MSISVPATQKIKLGSRLPHIPFWCFVIITWACARLKQRFLLSALVLGPVLFVSISNLPLTLRPVGWKRGESSVAWWLRPWVAVPDKALVQIHVLFFLRYVTLGYLFTPGCLTFTNGIIQFPTQSILLIIKQENMGKTSGIMPVLEKALNTE